MNVEESLIWITRAVERCERHRTPSEVDRCERLLRVHRNAVQGNESHKAQWSELCRRTAVIRDELSVQTPAVDDTLDP